MDALYAGLPGGFVMPCFEPVSTTAHGCVADAPDCRAGRKVAMPLMAPKRFVSKICVRGESGC